MALAGGFAPVREQALDAGLDLVGERAFNGGRGLVGGRALVGELALDVQVKNGSVAENVATFLPR